MRSYRTLSLLMFGFAVSAAACLNDQTADTSSVVSAVGNVHGAVFTTTVNGDRVNANIYPAKTDVYLDGGPPENAPPGSAALPEGDYFFQVTDPSGKVLLSTDHISCRRVHVNANGVFDVAYAGTIPVPCQHATGVDQDQTALGAITVQLMPYADTPNNGGEYKMWVTPVGDYTGDPTDPINDIGWSGGNSYGFDLGHTKTDNFKVKIPGTPEAPPCGDGILQTGEQCDDGNTINDDGCSSTCTLEPACGDGQLDLGEQCDDGNTANGDGCSSVCTKEEHPPEPPAPCCGDHHLDPGETCDDGNTTGGDGCSATCQDEDWNEPSSEPACLTCAVSVSRD